MTEVLGLPLSVAEQRLEAEGKQVVLIEVCCKKGTAGDDARVIKAEQCGETVTLHWAYFRTKPLTAEQE